MIRFAFGIALSVFPLFLILWRALPGWSKGVSQPFSGPFRNIHESSEFMPGFSSFLLWCGMLFLVIALARPQSGYERLPTGVEGVDIVIALDVSSSMLQEDYRPDRLEAAKDAALEFIEGRGNDRIGLVVYAAQPRYLCPPTFDHATLERYIRNAELGNIPDGTAIGAGLASAASGLEYSQSERRVIVLISDGEETSGQMDPRTVAQAVNIIHGDSLRVYTVAIGTESPEPGFGVDKDILQAIAEINGGRLFSVESSSDMEAVYASIDSLEASTLPPEGLFVYHDLYFRYLLLGFVLLIAGLLLKWSVGKVTGD